MAYAILMPQERQTAQYSSEDLVGSQVFVVQMGSLTLKEAQSQVEKLTLNLDRRGNLSQADELTKAQMS
jgi:hypothetical protein